jgi:hypothetical protein
MGKRPCLSAKHIFVHVGVVEAVLNYLAKICEAVWRYEVGRFDCLYLIRMCFGLRIVRRPKACSLEHRYIGGSSGTLEAHTSSGSVFQGGADTASSSKRGDLLVARYLDIVI